MGRNGCKVPYRVQTAVVPTASTGPGALPQREPQREGRRQALFVQRGQRSQGKAWEAPAPVFSSCVMWGTYSPSDPFPSSVTWGHPTCVTDEPSLGLRPPHRAALGGVVPSHLRGPCPLCTRA